MQISRISPLLIDSALYSGILLLFVLTLYTCLGRRSAAWRHCLLAVCFCGLLVLPLLVLLLPRGVLPILPYQVKLDASNQATLTEPRSNTFDTPPAIMTPATSETLDPAQATAPDWPLLLWSLGLAGGLIWLGSGLLGVANLRGASRNLTEPAWLSLLQELKIDLDITRKIELRRGRGFPGPAACGVLRPFIFLPEGSADWDPERRRIVLLHELSHIKRRDLIILTVAKLGAILYWYNPLAWLAYRRLRLEGETAVDDRVIECVKPSAYAGNLLLLVMQDYSWPRAVAGMANRSNFERRIRHMLAEKKNHAKLHMRSAFIIAGALLAFTAAAVMSGPMRAQASGTAVPTIWPLQGTIKISCNFGWGLNPLTQETRNHRGIDLKTPMGTPVLATADGRVTEAGWFSGYGYRIIIAHADGCETLYAHLSKFLVEPGDQVKQGDSIALSGSTGMSTGPHLHYEIHLEGKPIDPLTMLAPPAGIE